MSDTVLDESAGVEIKVVGKSGQISLGKRYAGKTFRLERFKDGRLVLTAVALVPETQLWTLAEPHRSRIERGLAWAAETQPQETNINTFLRRGSKGGKRRRVRRS
jgi:hypothetical protein